VTELAIRQAEEEPAEDGCPEGRYPPIADHGVIGDMRTVALVGIDGTIRFLCLPRYDSPTVFASLLDADKGGSFTLQPVLSRVHHKQMYLPDTNVLLTRFLSEEGVAEISDFMPVEEESTPSRIVRRVKTIRGQLRFRMRCAPRFDYARAVHGLDVSGNEARFVPLANDALPLRLRSQVPLAADGPDAVAEFTLGPGETASFVLEAVTGTVDGRSDESRYVSEAFKQTVNFWRGWIGRSTYRGRWRDEVHRSALILKLLTSRDTGAVVASPTFGLPERVGGMRNWDYRYTWIRDTSFTMYALIRLGLTSETEGFMRWLARLPEPAPGTVPLKTLYAVDGSPVPPETELTHLEGYRCTRPVRIGNAAQDQLQLDIFGELLDALYLYDKYDEPTSYNAWIHVAAVTDWVCENWDQADQGVWEVRTGPRPFLYSRVLCWVAVDRALRLAEKRSFPAPVERWRAVRDAIYQEVFERFWSPELKAFVGWEGSGQLDAGCLIMPLVRFISPTDPQWLSTLRAVEQRLVDDSLVFRYEINGTDTDGLEGTEGTFSICSFWYVECLSRAGDVQQARFLFEKMLGYANHLGLFSEEIGPSGELLGNFPQALTHLALISAAYELDRRLSAEESGGHVAL
jgi:GH15 family glucan-1,4-alpha-glucosidase